MSTINETTEQKIKCVTRAKADIIFLSDTRLNSDNQIVGVNILTKKILQKNLNVWGTTFFTIQKGQIGVQAS